MSFENIKSLDDLIKTAEVEVLLASISCTQEGPQVYPVKCPAVGRKDDYLRDMNDNPVCALGNRKCKYFQLAEFKLEDYTKRIICLVINQEDLKKSI
ncbi:MAG TPA: hypothetical protein P5136_00430 [Methanofastidiosum sp.]|nr:hypothetical protein [Methanofastidiosum sp.]